MQHLNKSTQLLNPIPEIVQGHARRKVQKLVYIKIHDKWTVVLI